MHQNSHYSRTSCCEMVICSGLSIAVEGFEIPSWGAGNESAEVIRDRFALFIAWMTGLTDDHQVFVTFCFGFANPEAFWANIEDLLLLHGYLPYEI